MRGPPTFLVLPEALESMRRQRCVPRRILNVAISEVRLQRPRIDLTQAPERGLNAAVPAAGTDCESKERVQKESTRTGRRCLKQEDRRASIQPLSSTSHARLCGLSSDLGQELRDLNVSFEDFYLIIP